MLSTGDKSTSSPMKFIVILENLRKTYLSKEELTLFGHFILPFESVTIRKRNSPQDFENKKTPLDEQLKMDKLIYFIKKLN